MAVNTLIHLSCWLAEGASEEPGDEGADGSDEEPAVGRQRHVDAEEMTVLGCFFIIIFFVFLKKTPSHSMMMMYRWRGDCWMFCLRWLTTPVLVLLDWDAASWRSGVISFGSYRWGRGCPAIAIDKNNNNILTNSSLKDQSLCLRHWNSQTVSNELMPAKPRVEQFW